MAEVLRLETRQRIFGVVSKNPGLSARDIQRLAGLGWGETSYHLERLEDAGVLRRERAPNRDFYFASDITWDDRKYLVLLRGENSRRLLLELLREPRLTAADLSARLRLSRSTVYFHLTRLVQGGLLHGERDNTTRRYRVAHPEQALRLLESYRENFREEVVSRFVEVWGPLLPQR